MKKIKFLLLAFSIMAISLVVSCSDQLDEEVFSELLTTTAYETAEDAEALILSVYVALRGPSANWGAYYDYDFMLMSESGTDLYGLDGWEPGTQDYEVGTFTNTQQHLVNLWDGAYKVIGAANFAIPILQGMPIDEGLKNKLIGEAKFLRGLAYYDLAFNFGQAILNIGDTSGNLPLSPQDAIIAQCMQDFTDAAAALGSSSTPGRASKGAALGMRAKTNLNAKNWAEAAADAKAVMDLGNHELASDIVGLFDASNNTASEWVFAKMSSQDGSGTDLILGWFTNSQGYVNGSWGRMTIAPDFYNSFEDGDDRKKLMPNGYQHGGMAMDNGLPRYYALPGTLEHANLTADPNVSVRDLNSMMTVKYLGGKDRFVYDAQSQHGANYPILRYSDVLLTRAEGLNETGDTGGAMALVNQVRARSNATPIAGLDQSSLRDAILEERGLELFQEGHRRLDLIRSGKYVQMWKANLETKYPGENFGYISDNLKFFPIPQKEIDANDQIEN